MSAAATTAGTGDASALCRTPYGLFRHNNWRNAGTPRRPPESFYSSGVAFLHAASTEWVGRTLELIRQVTAYAASTVLCTLRSFCICIQIKACLRYISSHNCFLILIKSESDLVSELQRGLTRYLITHRRFQQQVISRLLC